MTYSIDASRMRLSIDALEFDGISTDIFLMQETE